MGGAKISLWIRLAGALLCLGLVPFIWSAIVATSGSAPAVQDGPAFAVMGAAMMTLLLFGAAVALVISAFLAWRPGPGKAAQGGPGPGSDLRP